MGSSGTIFLSIASLGYIIMLLFVYFTKERVSTSENTIFSKLLIISFLSLLSELYIALMPINMDILPFKISLKVYLVLCVFWISYFMEYVFIITRNNKKKELIDYKKDYKVVYCIFWIVTVIVALLAILLPISFHNEVGIKYSYGPSVNVLFALSGIYTVIMLFYIIKNFKHLKEKGYKPIIFLVLLLLSTAIIQKINPGLLIANTCFALITTLMYYTIENPDIRMIKDLSYARKIEKVSKKRTLNTLDEMQNKIKSSIKEIFEMGLKEIEENDANKLKKEMHVFQKKSVKFAEELLALIDLSKISSGEVSLMNEKYDVKEAVEDLEQLIKIDRGNQNITTIITQSKQAPSVLYGDSKKIEQSIIYIFRYLNSIIKSGKIYIDMNNIMAGRFCKVKFYVRVYKSEVELYKDYRSIEFKKVFANRSDDINYATAKKIISLFDNDFAVDNNEEFFEIILAFNQRKISPYEYAENEIENSGIRVRTFDLSSKRMIIVDDNTGKIKNLMALLSPYKIKCDIANNYKELFDYISSDKTYDWIIMDDIIHKANVNYDNGSYNPYNGETDIKVILKRLRELAKYSIKFTIMLSDDANIEEYLDFGFDNYIIKPINKGNLNLILKEHFKNNEK